jgi:hypothetical protein
LEWYHLELKSCFSGEERCYGSIGEPAELETFPDLAARLGAAAPFGRVVFGGSRNERLWNGRLWRKAVVEVWMLDLASSRWTYPNFLWMDWTDQHCRATPRDEAP